MNHFPIDPEADRTRSEPDVVGTIALGGRVRHLATSPDGEHVYATTSDSVNVIDRRHRVIACIPVAVDPRRTLVSSDGSRLYVTGYDRSLSIIRTADYTAKTVDCDQSTVETVGADDNYLYRVHNQGRNCWASVMSDDGVTVTAAPVDSYASALAVSPDGGRLYITSSKPRSTYQHGHGSIAVIDTATFTLIDLIAMRVAPDTINVSPDGRRLYVTHYNESAISVIEPASHTQTLIGLDDIPLDIAINTPGDRLYVTNLHSIALIDAATHEPEILPIGDLPRHLHLSGDGKRVYVTDLGHHTVWVLDPVEKAIITTIDLGRHPEAVSASADGQFLYVADSAAPALAVVSLASHEAA